MDNENNDFRTPGQLISALLEQRGWTKRSLSVVLAVSEATIGKYVLDMDRPAKGDRYA